MGLALGLATAPGRLDFLGGVADYSGSLVLETPIRAKTTVAVREVKGSTIKLASGGHGSWEISVDDLLALRLGDAPIWTRYVLGCVWALSQTKGWTPRAGLDVRIRSNVPENAGVASSAALEVAVLRALGQLARVRWKGTELARLAQQAENDVVGAPCGLMDQLTAHHGQVAELLPILCRPDLLVSPIRLPRGVRIVGWHSGVKHSVSGSPYRTARTATFMGRRILEEKTGLRWDHAAEIVPSTFARLRALVPESIRGDSFRRRYGDTSDPLSVVGSGKSYRVRDALEFPVRENSRAELAACLLQDPTARGRDGRLMQVGELMLQSHEGYSALGLGAAETDQMVDAAMELPGIYGARVSGGGSGGTVVVLLKSQAMERLQSLVEQTSFGGVETSLIQ